jgi:hypothetical protein
MSSQTGLPTEPPEGLHCALCGAPARTPFDAPTAEIGPDLDGRPGEPVRSLLPDWVQMCRSCGAAAPNLSTLPASAKAVVESAPYQSQVTTVSEECLPFLRWAMLCRAAGDTAAAAEATLQAAWAADDAAAHSEAARLRREVAALWGAPVGGAGDPPADTATALRLLDVLRRAGEFAAVEALGAKLAARALDAEAAAVLAFQRARAANRDIGRHLSSSVHPAAADAPHAGHTP